MTTSTITARRKGDPQHYVEGKNGCVVYYIGVCQMVGCIAIKRSAALVCGESTIVPKTERDKRLKELFAAPLRRSRRISPNTFAEVENNVGELASECDKDERASKLPRVEESSDQAESSSSVGMQASDLVMSSADEIPVEDTFEVAEKLFSA